MTAEPVYECILHVLYYYDYVKYVRESGCGCVYGCVHACVYAFRVYLRACVCVLCLCVYVVKHRNNVPGSGQ